MIGELPTPGTPAWWTSRPAAATSPRRGRPRRSFERIVEVATELLDEVGPDGFSMRLLAERAQTGTATLYRHVAGKEELLVYAVDALFAEALLEEDDGAADGDRPPTWQEAARAVSLRFHRLLAHHPNLVPLLVAQVPIGPRGLVMREQTLATLTGYGFSTRVAARAYTALAHYVVGFAIQQQSAAAQQRESEALRGYYRALDPAAFGATVAAADDLTTVSSEEEFLEGLDFMLEGINRARVEGRPTASG